MKPLLVLTDKQIFPDCQLDANINYKLRLAVKVIVFDANGRLALVGKKDPNRADRLIKMSQKNSTYDLSVRSVPGVKLLPGGGVEEEETLEEAVWREVREEVGCSVKIEREIGVTEEYRAKIGRHQETHFFLVTVVGDKGVPTTTQEDEQGIEVEWFTLDQALIRLESQIETIPFKSYHACFNVRTQLAVLKEFKRLRVS